MVGIFFLSSFHWPDIHGSKMYITHIKHNSRTLYVVSNIQVVKLQSRFSQNDKKHNTDFLK